MIVRPTLQLCSIIEFVLNILFVLIIMKDHIGFY